MSMENKEIDLVELAKTIWRRRGFVFRVAGVVLAIGLFVAIFSPVSYEAHTVFMPQTGSKKSGNMQSLAAVAGINLNSDNSDVISEDVYPTVIRSVPFSLDMMDTTITVDGVQVTLFDYFTSGKYGKFSLLSFVKRYTIGLPGVILGALKGKPVEVAGVSSGVDSLSSIVRMTRDQSDCQMAIRGVLELKTEVVTKSLKITATMPDPLMAAEVAESARRLLQSYVTRFKQERAAATLQFVEDRCEEARASFENSQRALASWRDSNRDLSSAVARTREERLISDNNLAYSIYSELARHREHSKIKVKEDTPVFTVLEPVTVPLDKSAPKRTKIVLISLLGGLFGGVVLALLNIFAKELFGTKSEEA